MVKGILEAFKLYKNPDAKFLFLVQECEMNIYD